MLNLLLNAKSRPRIERHRSPRQTGKHGHTDAPLITAHMIIFGCQLLNVINAVFPNPGYYLRMLLKAPQILTAVLGHCGQEGALSLGGGGHGAPRKGFINAMQWPQHFLLGALI